jgi:hypothetical protein
VKKPENAIANAGEMVVKLTRQPDFFIVHK